MNLGISLFILCHFLLSIFSTNANQNGIARYDNYHLYTVDLATDEHVKLFKELEANSDSVVFIGHPRHPQQKLITMVAAHKVADFEDLLATYELTHRILSDNFQEKIDKNLLEVQPKSVDSNTYDWQHYYHLETINSWLQNTAKNHPNVTTLLDMGASVQNESMLGLKLAHDPNNKAIFIESGIHAREWIAPATATYIINELLTSKDIEVQRLASSYNWFIFPVVNPDGYKYSFEKDRMWRKSRALFGICRGVDLNRNFPFHWNTTGTSGDPCRYDFSGPSAASERETQNIINFLKANAEKEHIQTFLSLHSYSQLIMFPYGHSAERVKNYADLTVIAKKAAERIKEVSGRIYNSGSIFETIYPSSGGSKDWAYAEINIPVTLTFELRGPHNSEDSFILPANEIKPTAKEAFEAIKTIVLEAEKLGYYN